MRLLEAKLITQTIIFTAGGGEESFKSASLGVDFRRLMAARLQGLSL